MTRGTVRTDWRNSIRDFARVVLPELEQLLGGRIEVTEAGDRTGRLLDIDGGFDAICRRRGGIVGLANRVQWTTRSSRFRAAAAPPQLMPRTEHRFCQRHSSWFCPCVAPELYRDGGAERWT